MTVLPDFSPFSAYLGMTPDDLSADGAETLVRLPVVPGLCGAEGVVRAGILGTLVDTAGGYRAILDAAPDWIATADLTVRSTRVAATGDLVARARTLRTRRHSIVIDVRVVDAPTGADLAHSMLTFALLGDQRELADAVRPRGELRPVGEPSLVEAGFVAPRDRPNAVTVDIVGVLRNHSGGLVGGAITALVDAAACRAVGPGVEVDDLTVWFLAPGRVGPIVAEASVVGSRDGRTVVRVETIDEGNEHRLCAVATAVVGVHAST